MGCNTCSRVRCKLLAFVSGKSLEIREHCGVADVCHLDGSTYNTGSTWATFVPYLRLLRKEFVLRLYRKFGTEDIYISPDSPNRWA